MVSTTQRERSDRCGVPQPHCLSASEMLIGHLSHFRILFGNHASALQILERIGHILLRPRPLSSKTGGFHQAGHATPKR